MLGEALRMVVVQPPGTKPTDPSRGLDLLKDLLEAVEPCEFGLWTNGRDVAYWQKIPRPIQSEFVELSDFPGNGESLDDLNRPDRRVARIDSNDRGRYVYGLVQGAPRRFVE